MAAERIMLTPEFRKHITKVFTSILYSKENKREYSGLEQRFDKMVAAARSTDETIVLTPELRKHNVPVSTEKRGKSIA